MQDKALCIDYLIEQMQEADIYLRKKKKLAKKQAQKSYRTRLSANINCGTKTQG